MQCPAYPGQRLLKERPHDKSVEVGLRIGLFVPGRFPGRTELLEDVLVGPVGAAHSLIVTLKDLCKRGEHTRIFSHPSEEKF